MNTKRMGLVAGVLSAIVLSAPLALAQTQAQGSNLIVTNLRGSLRVSQGVPCGGVVEATTSIADGRMHISPTLVRGDVSGADTVFDLTRLDMFFTPFAVEAECLGVKVNVEFREIGVRLAGAIQFTGQNLGDGYYRFVIPRQQFLIYESVVTNLPVPQPMSGYKRPSEDVTGEIDTRRGTVELHVALSSRLRFRLGCVGDRCAIDEVHDGRQTTDIAGSVHVPGTDRDGDGVPDLTDNCPLVPNATQSPIATPVLTPPADVALSSCAAHNTGLAEATDVCHARPVAITYNAPATFAMGPNLVTWRASDGIDPPVFAQQRVTISGADTTPPTLSCTAVAQPRQHRVAATDDCGGRLTLKLGTFSVANGEVIQIEETGKPGVRLLGTAGDDKIRHFQVGKGEAFVVATDDAGNTARAACNLPLDTTARQ
jgi:hypothetical protein